MELKIENIEEYDFINNLTHKTPEQKAALKVYEATAGKIKKSGEQRPHVRTVNPATDDVIKAGGFKFNWKDAYENVKEERLTDSEADAKKLTDFINSNLYTFNDKSDIRDKAKDLHLWNPNTEKWTDFIQSERGDEFQKYLLDAQKTQQEKRVDEIWSGKDGKLTNLLTDFMTPVSKEYGKKNYENINGWKDMAGPLAADILPNFVMTGLGSGLMKSRPLISWLYGNAAAPAITETGNVIFNDQSIPEGLARTGEGVAINLITPRLVNAAFKPRGGGEGKIAQRMINEKADKARKLNKRMKGGEPFPSTSTGLPVPKGYVHAEGAPQLFTKFDKRGNPTIYSSDPARSRMLNQRQYGSNFKDITELPKNTIKYGEIMDWHEGIPLVRGKNLAGGVNSPKGSQKRFEHTVRTDTKKLSDINYKQKLNDKAANSYSTHGNLDALSADELRHYQMLKEPKYDRESYSNYLTELFKELAGDVPVTYATNMAGRPYAGRRLGPVRWWNQSLGQDLDMEFFKKDASPEEAQQRRINEMLKVVYKKK